MGVAVLDVLVVVLGGTEVGVGVGLIGGTDVDVEVGSLGVAEVGVGVFDGTGLDYGV